MSRWLLIIAFAFKAMLAPGLMVDAASLSSGIIKVVICTPDGHELIYLDENGQQVNQNELERSSEFCPFGSCPTATLHSTDFSVFTTYYYDTVYNLQNSLRDKQLHSNYNRSRAPPPVVFS